MNSFPSRHIAIVGAIVIALGVDSILGMLAGMVGGWFAFDLGFLGVPIGCGILMGGSSSRKWILFIAVVGVLLSVGYGCWLLLDQFNGERLVPYPDWGYAVADSLVSAVCCTYVLVILLRKSNQEWFGSLKENIGPSKTVAWSVVVASAVVLFSHYTTALWVEDMHARMFPVRTIIKAYDSSNGKGIGSLAYESDGISSDRGSNSSLPKIDVIVRGSRDGIELEFSGTAARPVEVVLKSGGYQDARIVLDRYSEYVQRVDMHPVEADKSGDGVPGVE